MARFRIARRPIKRARIEIVPMIDTIFFLLVFFMFTSLSMVQMKGMGVGLPKAGASASKPAPRAIVRVNKQGLYFLDSERIDPSKLTAALEQRVMANPQTVVVVDVDKDQDVQTLIGVMDSVNGVTTPSGGAPAVMVATTPVDSRGNAVRVTGRS